jgi:prepilin-type N-terminal cleavage/methylation domain-containing protein
MLKCLNAKMLEWQGFTLVELLVSIFIIVLISGIIFANYRVGGQQFALQRSANKLAQDIRRAQAMAMGAAECPAGTGCAGSVPPGYGIYLSQGNTNYLLYADTNQAGGNQNYDGGDASIDTINLEKGVEILSASPSSFSINFKPPDPTVTIRGSAGDVSTATITLALLTDTSKTKTITVNSTGLIEIQ